MSKSAVPQVEYQNKQQEYRVIGSVTSTSAGPLVQNSYHSTIIFCPLQYGKSLCRDLDSCVLTNSLGSLELKARKSTAQPFSYPPNAVLPCQTNRSRNLSSRVNKKRSRPRHVRTLTV